jgi:hypothetical protein
MAVLLAALGVYLYFVEFPAEKARHQSETQAKKLVSFDERSITGLTIRSASGEPEIVLALGEKGTWMITAPIRTEADSREVNELLRTLALGTVTRVIEEQPASLASFGLEPPAVTFTLEAGERKETLALGDVGPISSTLYAMRQSDKKVLLTDLPPKILLTKTLASLRRKEVLPLAQDSVDRLQLSNPKAEVLLERTEEKGKQVWRIRSPIGARADQPVVRNLLVKLSDLRAVAFVDAGPERSKLAARLGEPLVKITATVSGADRVVKLYQPDPSSGEAYAVTTPEAPIYKVDPTVIQDFTKDLFALRDKRLLGIDLDQIESLAITTRNTQYVLVSQNVGEWALKDEPDKKLDQQRAALFVSRVVDLPAEQQIAKEGSPLAPYGLSSPAAEFVATSKSGNQQYRLVLGNTVSGLVYAMGSGLPGIYQARADLLTQIPDKDSLLVKDQVPGKS